MRTYNAFRETYGEQNVHCSGRNVQHRRRKRPEGETSSEWEKRQGGETSCYPLASAFNTYLAVFSGCKEPSLVVFGIIARTHVWLHESYL